MELRASQAAPAQGFSERPIQITPYDPAWPARYAAESARLAESLGKWAVGGIHHVGSTAIPGVDAEPVIDILIGIEELAAARSCTESLARLDYLAIDNWGAELCAFCKPHPHEHAYTLYLAPAGGLRYSEIVAFRDFLRANRQVAIGYAGMKRDLAGRHGGDRHGYNVAKARLIEAVLDRLE